MVFGALRCPKLLRNPFDVPDLYFDDLWCYQEILDGMGVGGAVTEQTDISYDIPELVPQSRPERPEGLLVENVTYQGWPANNTHKIRFRVVNFSEAQTEARIDRQDVAANVPTAIEALYEIGWGVPNMDWNCSATTVLNRLFDNTNPKQPALLFSRCVIIILAHEMAVRERVNNPFVRIKDISKLSAGEKKARIQAAEEASKVDIYKYLKILPASYYIDGLSSEAIKALKGNQVFVENALKAMKASPHRPEILDSLMKGATMTKAAALGLRGYLMTAHRMELGEVLFTRDDVFFSGDAVAHLHYPRTMTDDEIIEHNAIS